MLLARLSLALHSKSHPTKLDIWVGRSTFWNFQHFGNHFNLGAPPFFVQNPPQGLANASRGRSAGGPSGRVGEWWWRQWDSGGVGGGWGLSSRERIHIPPLETENHLQKVPWKGYVGSKECRCFCSSFWTEYDESTLKHREMSYNSITWKHHNHGWMWMKMVVLRILHL